MTDTKNTSADTNPPPVVCTPAHASKGEKIYNWGVYSFINYWVNLGISLVIADYFTHGQGKGLVNRFESQSTRAGVKNALLNSGGWILLAPMRYMENHKRHIVHWINKKLGVAQVDANGNELGPEEIYLEKEQKHQTWLKVFLRRTLASGSTIVAAKLLDPAFARKMDKPIVKNGKTVTSIGGYDRFTDFIVGKSESALKSGIIPGGKALAEKEWVHRYLSMGVIDAINTKLTATIMRMTNGARHAPTPHAIDKEPPDAPMKPGADKADLTRFQSKKILPKENFAAMAKKNEPDYSLAP